MNFLKKLVDACRIFWQTLRASAQTPAEDAPVPRTLRVFANGEYRTMTAVRLCGLHLLCLWGDSEWLVDDWMCEDPEHFRRLWLDMGGSQAVWASDGAPARPWD